MNKETCLTCKHIKQVDGKYECSKKLRYIYDLEGKIVYIPIDPPYIKCNKHEVQ